MVECVTECEQIISELMVGGKCAILRGEAHGGAWRRADERAGVLSQLKRLERLRQNVFRSVKMTLKNIERSRDVADKASGQEAPRHDAEKKARYFGAPFSYYGSMKGHHRPELLDKCERITPTTDRDVY